MTLDVYCSQPYYQKHLSAVTNGLRTPATYLDDHELLAGDPDRPILVASFGDLQRVRMARRRHVALMEHGAGQSYGGGGGFAATHPSYPGGINRHAELFLSTNEQAAGRDAAAYPKSIVRTVGSARVGLLPSRVEVAGEPLTVAISFHWPSTVAPEAGWAFVDFRNALRDLPKHCQVIGHAHPRVFGRLKPWFQRYGIEPVADFDDVCRRADLYIADNSSSLFEFASTDRPVVLLNAKKYRKNIHHGLRFWTEASVGPMIDPTSDVKVIVAGIESALDDPVHARNRREVVRDVYPYTTPTRAVQEINAWVRAVAPETASAARKRRKRVHAPIPAEAVA